MPSAYGYDFTISQAVVDHVAAYTAHGGRNLGTIGDRKHWTDGRISDHTSKPATGHAGWVTANDSDSGGSYDADDFVRGFLLPALRAGKYAGQIKFLNFRGRQYGGRGQDQGSNPDHHLHISFANSMHRRRWTGTADYFAGRGGGRYVQPWSVDHTWYVPGRAPVYGLSGAPVAKGATKVPWTIPGWTFDARRVPAQAWGQLPPASKTVGAGSRWQTDVGRVNFLNALYLIPQYDDRSDVRWAHHFGLPIIERPADLYAGGGYFGRGLADANREWALKHGLSGDDASGRITPALIGSLTGQVVA